MIQGTVEVLPAGASAWKPGKLNQLLHPGDRVRTGERSRAEVYLINGMTIEKGELSEIEIPPTPEVNFLKGLFKILFRGSNSDLNMHGATAAIRGTDFLVLVKEDKSSELTVLDGEVLVTNEVGKVVLTNYERGLVAIGSAPRKTAVLEATKDLIQWSLYYPGVINADELSSEEQRVLADSLNAYRQGDLLQAMALYPWARPPGSGPETVYRAALLLTVGQVEKASAMLEPLNSFPLAQALQQLIAAVKFETRTRTHSPQLSSEWVAESYYRQSRNQLEEALVAARAAVSNAPSFGFGWERVAELEFSFGRTDKALSALEKSLQLAPRNAQAVALKGFLLAAQNRIAAAREQFEQAIEIDSALGNAWLGRGLCNIRQGRREEGLRDLMVAASLESQRSLLHSYLGKAFADAGDDRHAIKELSLAKNLDPGDPTSWLYSALLKQQQNRVNEAISDLESSQERNDNRSLFRSRLLLDEDSAVRSANLASIYRDAGMNEVSLREAARAVTYDYANDSAHLFLSDSYNELRDPTRFNLRYETVWFNELLLANMLAPVGAGRLSQHLSQQEYSSLFQADGLGIASSTLGRSDEKSVRELVSQFGTFGRTSYAFDLDYENKKGVRPNNDLQDIEWYTTIKQQITPQDTLLALIKYEDYHSGDNFQYFDPHNPTNGLRRHFDFEENQHPIAVAGWHHEWSPGMHTLLLGGRLENDQRFSDRSARQLLLIQDGTGAVVASDLQPFDINYHGTLEIYTTELNQIFQWNRVSISAGGRYQWGEFDTSAKMVYHAAQPPGLGPLFDGTPTNTSASADFERITGYGYVTIEPIDHLWLTGGLTYDELTYPSNFRNPPISAGEDHPSQVGPKAAIVWSPLTQATLRGIYTRSLGGVSLDESYRLEPTQLAGFPQSFRTLISESVVGSVAGPKYETFGLALDLKFSSRTYAGIEAQRLTSDVHRTIGVFSLENGLPPFTTATTPEHLDYRENSFVFTLNQLLGDNFVVGAAYKFDQAKLSDTLTDVPRSVIPQSDLKAELHETSGYILFNHHSGFFARAETQWYHQVNYGYTPSLNGDDFFQHNIFAGYRFGHRHIELLVGILNLTDEDYHLNPLTVYAELPRERTYIARLKFQF